MAGGALKQADHTNDIGSLTYVIYGLTDRISVGVIPTAGYNTAGGSPGSGVELGDTSVLAQYRLTQYQRGRWVPTTSIAVQETFPTGKYENLGLYPNSGIGGGVYSTKVSLYTQTFAWMPNGRILRLRLNFSNTFSGSANVEGVSVYGTGRTFRGSVKPRRLRQHRCRRRIQHHAKLGFRIGSRLWIRRQHDPARNERTNRPRRRSLVRVRSGGRIQLDGKRGPARRHSTLARRPKHRRVDHARDSAQPRSLTQA